MLVSLNHNILGTERSFHHHLVEHHSSLNWEAEGREANSPQASSLVAEFERHSVLKTTFFSSHKIDR